jgi:rhodanese-related sulfurtransferase
VVGMAMEDTIMLLRAGKIAVCSFALLSGIASYGSDSVDIQKAYKEVQQGTAVVIDVRDSVTIGSEVVNQAMWVRLPSTTNQLPEVFDRIATCLPREKKVYLYCYVGSFAGFFAEGLRSRGVNAVNAGGYDDWVFEGVPLNRVTLPAVNQTCPF